MSVMSYAVRRRQSMSLDDSCIKCAWGRIVVLKYSQLQELLEFGGFEKLLRDAGICAIPT